MAIPSIAYPLINGHRYSFASAEIIINGLPILGITSINYSEELAPGEIRGTRPYVIGRTVGESTVTCDFEMFRLEFEQLKATLGAAGIGYGETAFDVQVLFAELNQPVIGDFIRGCRITKAEVTNSAGSEGSKIKVTCHAMRVELNGVSLMAPR